jgi:hypothetical protein
VCCDPISSGGLLFAVDGWEEAVKIGQQVGGTIIGTVFKENKKSITIINEYMDCDYMQ